MTDPPPRRAALVLVDGRGELLGTTPRIPVATPWWQDIGPVVATCAARFGFRPIVLRLLESERPVPPGGPVTYLAEVADTDLARAREQVRPWSGTLDEHPLRATWARPGGPTADLAWAWTVVRGHGLRSAGEPAQVRTWHLSSIWRLPIRGGDAWLKVVPPFFAHEGAVIERLADHPVPRLLGRDGARTLMREIPGDDRYSATGPELLDMVDDLVTLQVATASDVEGLLAAGVPDWRGPSLVPGLRDVVTRTAPELDPTTRRRLEPFVEGLPDRLTAVAACGLPTTLVHGDFAPGNVRGDGRTTPRTILDWGDCTLGHPLLDQPAFLDRTPAGEARAIRAHWDARWRARVPGSDPTRAAELLRPVAAARQAMVYRRFLDGIEPSERVYHAGDPADWLRRTAAILAAED